jgi:hypothetical protein
MAMPLDEPLDELVDGLMGVVVDGDEDDEEDEDVPAGAAGAAEPPAFPLEPQAARPIGSAAAKATSAVVRRMFIGKLLGSWVANCHG